MIRTIVYGDLYWGPPILGNYHLLISSKARCFFALLGLPPALPNSGGGPLLAARLRDCLWRRRTDFGDV